MKKSSRGKFFVSAALVGLVTIPATYALAGTTELVSISSSGKLGNGSSWMVNATNGQSVVFKSEASNLVIGDNNKIVDIFVHERATGETKRVNVGPNGEQAQDGCGTGGISGDGRYVFFDCHTDADFYPGDNNVWRDAFVRDLQSGTTEMVSLDSDGNQQGSNVYSNDISADGNYVVFSTMGKFTSEDTGVDSDVFVRDLSTGITELISRASDSNDGDGFGGSISDNGQFVVFASQSSALVEGDTNGAYDIFVRDRVAGITERVSINSSGIEGNGASGGGVISADGRYVAYSSVASNLVANDNNIATDYDGNDIFVHDRQTGSTVRVSIADSGSESPRGAEGGQAMSSDGRYVAFRSSSDLAGDGLGRGLFVRDLQAGTTIRVSADGGDYDPVISPDGKVVAFTAYDPAIRGSELVDDAFVYDMSEAEICYDSIDNDGDGLVDCDDSDCGVCGNTVQVTYAYQNPRTNNLTVFATSGYGEDAALEMEYKNYRYWGDYTYYGPMAWNAKKSQWEAEVALPANELKQNIRIFGPEGEILTSSSSFK